jgi:hypothetical protein
MSASPDETLGCVMNLVRAVGILLLGANQVSRPIKLKSHAHYNTILEMAMIIFSETKTICWSLIQCRTFARIMNCKNLANRQQISLIGAQKKQKENSFLEVIVMSVYYYYLANHMIPLLQEKARADTFTCRQCADTLTCRQWQCAPKHSREAADVNAHPRARQAHERERTL